MLSASGKSRCLSISSSVLLVLSVCPSVVEWYAVDLMSEVLRGYNVSSSHKHAGQEGVPVTDNLPLHSLCFDNGAQVQPCRVNTTCYQSGCAMGPKWTWL